jgi:hypothetical protein
VLREDRLGTAQADLRRPCRLPDQALESHDQARWAFELCTLAGYFRTFRTDGRALPHPYSTIERISARCAGPLTCHSVQRALVYDPCDLTELPKAIGAEDLVFASSMGTPISRNTLDRMGHAQFQTTQTYLHTRNDSDQRSLDALTRVQGGLCGASNRWPVEEFRACSAQPTRSQPRRGRRLPSWPPPRLR